MDCTKCDKCYQLGDHEWRFHCTHCLCPNYFHNSYFQTEFEEDESSINWIDRLSSKSIRQINDYNEAVETAREMGLLWLPIGLEETNIDQFIEAYKTQLGLVNNKSNKLKRQIQIATQIPRGDCNVNEVTTDIDHPDLDLISEAEYNFKTLRDSNRLSFGEVEKICKSEICFNCKRNYVESDQFCIRILAWSASWHLSCFKCFKCKEALVDFHYYSNDDDNTLYCMKDFDDQSFCRCGSCNELIFNKDYTRAMDKDFHVEHFACDECDLSLTGGKFIVKEDKPFCLKCYENKFSHICDRCSEKISCDSKDLAYNDRHWHEKCFFCDNCKESLADKSFATKERELFCPNCYDEKFAQRCDSCEAPFRGGAKKYEYGGKQWHEECFRCEECEEIIGSKSFVPKNEKVLCVKCYENKYAQKCSKCKEIIRKGGVSFKSEPWHKECFTCTHCNQELSNTKFTSRDEKPYCANCFSELFSKRCKKCQKPISGFGGCKFISLEEDHWHTECFICTKCEVNLVGKGFLTHNLAIMCSVCGQIDTD